MEVVALILMSILGLIDVYNMGFIYQVIIYLQTKRMMYLLQYISY